MVNVGVDVWDNAPVSAETLAGIVGRSTAGAACVPSIEPPPS